MENGGLYHVHKLRRKNVESVHWVWNTNVALAQLENDLGDAENMVVVIEKKLSEADTNSKAIISIEKDIEYMKQTLGRIETLVANL